MSHFIIMLTKETAEHIQNIFCICIAVKYYSGLSPQKTSQQQLSPFIKRNHVSAWKKWIQQ
jgi:hypothetical protein